MTARTATDHLKNPERGKPPFARAYGFALVTGVLFAVSWVGQFVTQSMVVARDAAEHGEAFDWADFWPEFLASTFENWQSEFLQLVWQAVGLAFLFFWGSSQSRETEERLEAKIDLVLEKHGYSAREVTEDLNRSL